MTDVTAGNIQSSGDEAVAPAESGVSASGAPASPFLLTLGRIFDTLRRGDIALALGVMTILVMLILPMPAMMLDVFLAISIIFSVLILMTALFIQGRSNSPPSRRFC